MNRSFQSCSTRNDLNQLSSDDWLSGTVEFKRQLFDHFTCRMTKTNNYLIRGLKQFEKTPQDVFSSQRSQEYFCGSRKKKKKSRCDTFITDISTNWYTVRALLSFTSLIFHRDNESDCLHSSPPIIALISGLFSALCGPHLKWHGFFSPNLTVRGFPRLSFPPTSKQWHFCYGTSSLYKYQGMISPSNFV